METKREFKKQSHLFAHRKDGAQHRFRKEYIALRDKVQIAWMADIENMEAKAKATRVSNVALARNRIEREADEAKNEARDQMKSVFTKYRAEIDRIVVELGGHPQTDGNVVFPDGSVAKMPKGLFIPPADLLKLDLVPVGM